jgi:hypothetical protein
MWSGHSKHSTRLHDQREWRHFHIGRIDDNVSMANHPISSFGQSVWIRLVSGSFLNWIETVKTYFRI